MILSFENSTEPFLRQNHFGRAAVKDSKERKFLWCSLFLYGHFPCGVTFAASHRRPSVLQPQRLVLRRAEVIQAKRHQVGETRRSRTGWRSRR